MIRSTLATAMLALAGLLAISVAPAAAEFTSNNEGTEGGANFQISIEGAGPAIDCGETETNQLAWQIKEEGKASESGPELALKFKSWGTCVVEYKEEELATLSGGECVWEASEPGSERKVTNKIASGCKLKGEIAKKSCEVTLEPKSNEKLSNLTLVNSGEENEHLAVNIELKGVTVGASGTGCETAGIKSTSAAELTGTMQAMEIAPGFAAPSFRVGFDYLKGNQMRTVGDERYALVSNFDLGDGLSAPGSQPGNGLFQTGNSPWFSVFSQTLSTCQTMPILITDKGCVMTVKYKMTSPRVVTLLFQIWEGGVVTSQVGYFAVT